VYWIFIISLTFFINSCSKKEIEQTKVVMGTFGRVMVEGGTENIVQSALDEMERIDKLLSDYRQDSEITVLNESAGLKPITVSVDTLKVIKLAIDIAHKTDGAFNPAIGAITIKLWNFGRNEILPTRLQISDALKLIDYRDIEINGQTIFLKKKGMAIDLHGIGKGYAVDTSSELLKKHDIKKGIVSIGGDIRIWGKNRTVGIKNPFKKEAVFATFITDNDEMAISTSGDYERFFERDGVKYSHIINPETGMPQRDFSSVTVICRCRNAIADAVATAIFAGGKSSLGNISKTFEDIGIFIIFPDGSVYFNDKFSKYVINLNISAER